MKVKVLNGDGSAELGVGEYTRNVGVFVFVFPEGLRTVGDATVIPTLEVIEYHLKAGADLTYILDNPEIVMEDGSVVYGCQVWWEPLEQMQEMPN